MDIAKFLRTSFFLEHLWGLFLTVLTQHSKVSCLFFDFEPPHAFDFDKKLRQNVAQEIISTEKAISSLLELIS